VLCISSSLRCLQQQWHLSVCLPSRHACTPRRRRRRALPLAVARRGVELLPAVARRRGGSSCSHRPEKGNEAPARVARRRGGTPARRHLARSGKEDDDKEKMQQLRLPRAYRGHRLGRPILSDRCLPEQGESATSSVTLRRAPAAISLSLLCCRRSTPAFRLQISARAANPQPR
jgi:hypothetical protein